MHDGIVKTLEQRLSDSPIPWDIKTHVEYGSKKSKIAGEIDILAETHINGKHYVLDIEVKYKDKYSGRHKAYQQLKRAYNKFSPNCDEFITMYAYGASKGKINISRIYTR